MSRERERDPELLPHESSDEAPVAEGSGSDWTRVFRGRGVLVAAGSALLAAGIALFVVFAYLRGGSPAPSGGSGSVGKSFAVFLPILACIAGVLPLLLRRHQRQTAPVPLWGRLVLIGTLALGGAVLIGVYLAAHP